MPVDRANVRDVRKNRIQEEDIRKFVGDDKPHDLLGGYAFSPEDIRLASRMAVDAFNELPPDIDAVTVELIPFSDIFLNAIADKLYTMKMQQLSHELLSYSVGDVQYKDKETRMAAYEKMQKKAEAYWTPRATNLKRRINLEQGYESIPSPYSWGYTGW